MKSNDKENESTVTAESSFFWVEKDTGTSGSYDNVLYLDLGGEPWVFTHVKIKWAVHLRYVHFTV